MKTGQLGPRLMLAAFIAAAGQTAALPVAAETLADALVKAVTKHPDIAASRAALRQADEGVVQEEAAGLGTVTGTASYGFTTGAADERLRDRTANDPLSLGVSGAIPIYAGGQVRYGVASAEQGVQATRALVIDTEQQVLLAAVTAYEDVRRDIQRVALARNNVRVISEQVRAARDRFDVGEVTRTDVSQAEARLAAARSNLAANVGFLATSRQAYVAAVGELPEGLTPPPPIPDLPKSEDAAVALALAEHPQMMQARYNARRAEYEVKRAVGAGLPSVELRGSVEYSQSAFTQGGASSNTASVSVVASVPFWTGGRQPSNVREAQAAVAQATAQIHATARGIQQTTALAWSNLKVARASISAARQQIRAAKIAFDGVREEATLGARTTLDVLDAEAELLSARVDLVTSLRDEYVAAYTLLAAVGKLTVAHLGLEAPGFDPEAYMEGVRAAPYEWADDESSRREGEWKMFDLRP